MEHIHVRYNLSFCKSKFLQIKETGREILIFKNSENEEKYCYVFYKEIDKKIVYSSNAWNIIQKYMDENLDFFFDKRVIIIKHEENPYVDFLGTSPSSLIIV